MITINFIIPVYNEEKRLNICFRALDSFIPPKKIQISKVIFVNDGSTDNTLNILKNTKIKFPKKIISYSTNKGKGYAVKTGLLKSKSDYSLLFDADISTPLSEIKKFVPFFKKNIPVIIGTRKNSHSTVTIHQPFIRENMGKAFTLLSNIILNTSVTDFTCGFKALSYEAIKIIAPKMTINRWCYDSEILFLAKNNNLTIQEKPVTWANEKNTKVNLIKDSIRSFYELILIRINHLNLSFPKSPVFSSN